MKKLAAFTSLLTLLAVSGVGFVYANRKPPQVSAASLIAGGSFGRTYDVSASSTMIDSDGDATIIHSGTNRLRFEETRLLIDGYVAATLTPEMRKFSISFTEETIAIDVDGERLAERSRANPRLAAMQHD
ncbi:hypothetical protein [Crateriforma conspicua]|uniref:Uncharacterized protein n=1 Tax=Crateriforma conspicua TaxID=2527996 RepID=A0A5C5XUD0_9PLAN|nr:hypothetical protein [Crateriforma conspicua]QDV66241.1 hypothetical protein Mal65_54170 [Crateriforma conspicua]TWT65625.1 hypothetical protein Pan14r_51720 [Crateriforma conspicua]